MFAVTGPTQDANQACIYTAQGDVICPRKQGAAAPAGPVGPVREGFGAPAFISPAAKKDAWQQRTANGMPMPATEWQDKGHEKPGWVPNPTPGPIAEGFKGGRRRA